MLELPLVWRGEHGPVRLATRLATLTFVDDRAAAECYAREPNWREDVATHPTLIQAQLTLRNPIVNSPEDPLLDYRVLAEAVGDPVAQALFVRHQDHVMATNAWEEVAERGFTSVSDVVARAPDLLDELCVQIYPLLDDAPTIAAFRQAGFDGAIHASNGATMDAVEYRVFDVSQVRVVAVETLTPPVPGEARRPRPRRP